MKKTIILLFYLIFCGCNNPSSNELKNIPLINEEEYGRKQNNYFEKIKYDKQFKLLVEKTYKGSNAVSCFGIGYHLIIGTTENKELPAKLTILYHSFEPYDLNSGDKITVVPEDFQDFENDGLGVIYMTSDTIINGKNEAHILGSENKSIWAERIEL